MGEALEWLPAWQLRQMMADRVLSPVEFMTHLLDRIDQVDPTVNAFLTVAAEPAMDGARAAEAAIMRGDALGPLHGVPVSLKDMLWTRSIRTTAGSLLFKDFVPGEDCITAERLKAAGAILFGKTNTPEFSLNRRSLNRLGRETVNPWDPERSAGGSSGGSGAAVAAGLGPISIGTDGGGSIRIPAAFNGVFGLHPSRGRVPLGPKFFDFPLEGVGPMTRDVRDAAITLQAIAGHDPREWSSATTPAPDYLTALDDGVKDLRIAWSADFGRIEPLRHDVVAVAHETARTFGELGAVYDEPTLRLENPLDLLELDPSYPLDLVSAGPEAVTDFRSLSKFLGGLRKDPEKWEKLCIYVKDRGDHPTHLEYTMSIPPRIRNKPIDRLDDIFVRYDLLLSPAIARPAFLCGEPGVTPWEYVEYTFVVNAAGYAAASVPAGFVDGMPVGLHIVGRPNEEALILRAARALEIARPWAQHRPPSTV